MAGGMLSVECSFLYVISSSFCSCLSCNNCAFSSHSILLNRGIDTFS